MIVNLVAFIFPTALSPAILSSTSILFGPTTVAQNSLKQKEFSDKQRATMGSLNSLAKNIFYGMCLVSLGWVADNVGPRLALITAQGLSVVAVWLTWKLFKMIRAEK
jgi:predicted MFS family arabinose efflux permease